MRIVPQLDTSPRLIAMVQTPAGKVAAVAIFAVLLRLANVSSAQSATPFLEVAAIAGIISFFPQYRRPLVSAAALYWLSFHGKGWLNLDLIRRVAAKEGLGTGPALMRTSLVVLIALFCALGLYLRIVRRHPKNLLGRRPVLVLICTFLCLLAGSTVTPHGLATLAVWVVLALACNYIWFFAYAVADNTSKAPDPYRLQFGTFFPFWFGSRTSPTPIGKGAAFLRKVEARTPRDLAIMQLKAVKLLIWLLILKAVRVTLRAALYGELPHRIEVLCRAHQFRVPQIPVPTLQAALQRASAGALIPVYLAWATLLSHFILDILQMTILGNTVVACCRMAGFGILRNTYKPLYAPSVAEFWNRYYFYFKELLVDFFFFPVYIRYFKKYRRLRLAAATLAAATFGNMLYHFCRDIQYVLDLGLWRAVAGFRVYAVYAVALGVGIVISQLSGKRAPQRPLPLYRRVIASAGVIGFFCLLEVFDYEGRSHTLHTHIAFLWNLFALFR